MDEETEAYPIAMQDVWLHANLGSGTKVLFSQPDKCTLHLIYVKDMGKMDSNPQPSVLLMEWTKLFYRNFNKFKS